MTSKYFVYVQQHEYNIYILKANYLLDVFDKF